MKQRSITEVKPRFNTQYRPRFVSSEKREHNLRGFKKTLYVCGQVNRVHLQILIKLSTLKITIYTQPACNPNQSYHSNETYDDPVREQQVAMLNLCI